MPSLMSWLDDVVRNGRNHDGMVSMISPSSVIELEIFNLPCGRVTNFQTNDHLILKKLIWRVQNEIKGDKRQNE